MIVKVFNTDGKEHQIKCDRVDFTYPDKKNRVLKCYDKENYTIAFFYTDKIIGYKIEREENASGETNENNSKVEIDKIEHRFDIMSARFDSIYNRLENVERVLEENGYVLKPCSRCGEIAKYIVEPIVTPDFGCYTGKCKLEIKCKECNLSVSECCDEDKIEETRKKLFKEWKTKEFRK